MPVPSKPVPEINEPNVVADPKIHDLLAELVSILTGNVDRNNLKDAEVLKAKLASDALNTFLKLLVPADRKLAFGAQAVNWPGGASLSSVFHIAHGLGAVPILHNVYMVDQGGTGYCKVAGGTQSSSELTGLVETVGGFLPPGGNFGTIGWWAIG